MPRLPIDIVESEAEQSEAKGYDGEVFESVVCEEGFGIELHELTDHPVGVGGDPDSDGEVMAEFRYEATRAPRDDDGDDQRGKDHHDAQWLPYHAPGHVLEEPEHDVQVFHLSVSDGNAVGVVGQIVIGHGSSFRESIVLAKISKLLSTTQNS